MKQYKFWVLNIKEFKELVNKVLIKELKVYLRIKINTKIVRILDKDKNDLKSDKV